MKVAPGCFLAVILLLLPILSPLLPNVLADTCQSPPNNTMFLPFLTGWENTDLKGTAQSGCIGQQVYSQTSNFYGPGGTGDNTPYLARVGTGAPFPKWGGTNAEGNGGDYALGAYGYFGCCIPGTYTLAPSMGLLKLFDNTIGDTAVHFRIRNHTAISVWYYHVNNSVTGLNQPGKNVMIDALLYNVQSKTYAILGDFSSVDKYGKTQYVVDQNNVRLNAGYRGSDKANAWLHSVFSLDPVYNSSPDNWYVMGIFVRFDNYASGSTGQAVSYFDNLRIVYSVSQAHPSTVQYWQNSSSTLGPFMVVTTATAWAAPGSGTPGYYDLKVKTSVTGFSQASQKNIGNAYMVAYPNNITVSAAPACQGCVGLASGYAGWMAPTAVNLTDYDISTNGKFLDFMFDVSMAILTPAVAIAYPGFATVLTVASLASEFLGILPLPKDNPGSLPLFLYSWPLANLNASTTNSMVPYLTSTTAPWRVATNGGSGEAYLTFNQVQAIGITLDGTVQFAYEQSPYATCRCYLTSFDQPVQLFFSSTPDATPSLPTTFSLQVTGSSSLTLYSSYTDGGSVSTTIQLTSASLYSYALSITSSGQPDYVNFLLNPNPSSIPGGGGVQGFTVTFSVDPYTPIYTDVTVTVTITASAGPTGRIFWTSQVTITLTVVHNCIPRACFTAPSP